MAFSRNDMEIMNRLVGPMDENTSTLIYENIDCFLHSKVGLFIPARGQCKYAITPSHTHPAYSFVYYFESVSELIIEGKSVSCDISDGKCLIAISPGIPHQEPEQDGFQSYIAIQIDAELFRGIFGQYARNQPVFCGERFRPHPELLGLLKCFMLETNEYECRNEDYLNQLALAVAHLTVRSLLPGIYQTAPLYDRFEVDRVIAYMNSHFTDRITAEELAALANLSTGYFTKIFKSVTGETPIDFLKTLRLKKARSMLLNSADNMTEIALKCGFNTSSYFSSCFIEKYRMTPTVFRQSFQQPKNGEF
ncbi:MAG: AraC family transcriptional regulator [Oscillospiraceae bacterium]|nr:AraC family transcriptional regulator [Oscillospiraceae bacterium]